MIGDPRRTTGIVKLLFIFASLALAAPVGALQYQDNEKLDRDLHDLAAQKPALARLQSVAKSRGGTDVWLLELGAGDEEARRQRPAFLLVAGIEGNDLTGTVSAVYWAERLAHNFDTTPAIRTLLESTTIYIFPRLNPDAAPRSFTLPLLESSVDATPTDDDHDGLVDEDGPDDLNGDGLITSLRVEDPEGEYILDPAEPRLLLKSDKTKGESGKWRPLTEGRDNDNDGSWNEDGRGGVNFNRNFPYNYKFFASDAGLHPVSTAETRALADFVVNHPNIAIVFTFGTTDNLTQTPKADEKSEKPDDTAARPRGGRKPATGIHTSDLPYFREFGKTFRDALGLSKELPASDEPGTFPDWMYFHRGRLSLTARAWHPSLQIEIEKPRTASPAPDGKKESEKKTDAASGDPGATKDSAKLNPDADKPKTDPEKRNEDERAVLKWIDANAPTNFVTWKPFEHPDFPGKKVEIGGYAPFAKSNPPARLLDELAGKHAKFLTELAARFPRIGIRKSLAKHLGESVYELTLQIENTGFLPTALAQGVLTREVLPTRVVLKLDDKEVLSGARITMLGPIDGSGGSRELRYIVLAKERKSIDVEVFSSLGGATTKSIPLGTN